MLSFTSSICLFVRTFPSLSTIGCGGRVGVAKEVVRGPSIKRSLDNVGAVVLSSILLK
jgi:hypothetical protein